MAEQVTDDAEYAARRRRVRRLKRMILMLLVTSILIPIILCVILLIRTQKLQEQIYELQRLVENKQQETVQETFVTAEGTETEATNIETQIVSNAYTAGEDKTQEAELLQEGRKVYLTFDDGPSCYTDEILDILAEYDVKATFFVVGRTDEASLNAYKRIVEEGHTLGMHSYSHKYDDIYCSVEAYAKDLSLLQELLYETTGVWSRYTRFPGGSSNQVSEVDMQELIAYLQEQDIQYYDWNISSGDAATGYVSAQSIVDNAIKNVEWYSTSIILMHDASDKKTTVEALPIIIEKLLAMEDVTLHAIDENTKLIQHIKATK